MKLSGEGRGKADVSKLKNHYWFHCDVYDVDNKSHLQKKKKNISF